MPIDKEIFGDITPKQLSDADIFKDISSQPTTVPDAPKQVPTTERGFLSKTISNIPSSAVKFATDLAHPFLHPVDTAKNLGDLALGGLNRMVKTPDYGVTLPSKVNEQKSVDATSQFFKDRYGGFENIKNTISTDPVGAAADASLLAMGGGGLLARAPGIAGKAGGLLSATGQAIDPITQGMNAIKGTAKVAESVVSNVLGSTTGAGAGALREAARAGAEGGKTAEAFQGQLRNTSPTTQVVDSLRQGLDNMRKDRAEEYTKNIKTVTQDKTVLSFNDIDKALAEVKSSGMYNGKVIDESASSTWDAINKKVDEWKNGDPAIFHTPEGLDALKKAIGDVRDSSEYGTPARRVADKAYNAVKNQIVKQAPDYAKVMKDYEEASSLLREMETTFSKDPKANVDSTVRRLQSILRNNANTNYGRRAELAGILKDNGASLLMPQLAGQALSSVTPRGLQGAGSSLMVAGAALHNPLYGAGLLATSPRVMGEAAYYGGKAGGNIGILAKQLAEKTGMSEPTARGLLYQFGRNANGGQ